MNPAQGLHLLQVFMLWQHIWHLNSLMRAQLWHEYNAAYFFYLWIVGRTDAVHVAGYLTPQIGYGYEFFEYVLGQYVGEARFFDVVRRNVNVICTQV